MKVLQVIDSLILAGAERVVFDLVPRLQRSGLEVSVLVLRELDSPFERELRAAGVPFLPTGKGGIYSPRQVRHIAQHMGGYDVVHVHLFPAQLWVALATALYRKSVPLLYTEHNTYNYRRRRWFRPIDRWMYTHYDAIACNSPATAEALVRWLPEVRPKARVVWNGVELGRFASAARAASGDVIGVRDVPIVSCVARFQPQKDHGTVLEAMARVERAHLVLVGDGELRPSLEAQTQRLGIRERVHFLGRREDVPALLKMSDVHVHSTNSDGFGLVSLEAMAAGVPAIATNVPGLAEVVGDAGVLVPPKDPAALAAAISSLLASPDHRQQLARAGQERARKFSMDATAAAYVSLYHGLTQGASRQAPAPPEAAPSGRQP